MTVPAGSGAAPAAAPHGGGDRLGMGQPGVEAELGDQAGRLRSPGQHRLGSDVDGVAGHLRAAQLSADDAGGLEDYHPNVAVLHQLPRCREPGDATTDDGDGGLGHGSTVAAES